MNGSTKHGTVNPAPPVRILVVDDHTIVRQGLRSILDLEPDFTVVGEAADAEQAVTETARLGPDVVLLDLMLSDRAPAEGLDVCAELRERHPGVSVVVLTTFLDERLLLGALRRGASGYALKDVDAVELARIIRSVHGGQSAFDPRSAKLVVRSLTRRARPARQAAQRPRARGRPAGRPGRDQPAGRPRALREREHRQVPPADRHAQARGERQDRACLPGERQGPAVAPVRSVRAA